MAESNSAVIKNIYAAFNRGDIESVLANVQPNAEWVFYGPASVPYFGNFTGRLTEFFQAIGQTTTGGNVAMDRYMESGENVITEGRYTAAVNATGARIDVAEVHIFTLRDGKVSSLRGYGDTAAIAAAHTGKAASA
jgi:ketosteroid isomerase-like protein